VTQLRDQLASIDVHPERARLFGPGNATQHRARASSQATARIPPSCQLRGTCKRRFAVLATGLLIASFVLAACSSSISSVNGKPDQHYGKVLRLDGRIGEIVVASDTGGAEVFHLVSKDGHRIIVVTLPAVPCRVGDRVYVRGEFIQERTVAGRSYYDVVSATTIRKAGMWNWIPFL